MPPCTKKKLTLPPSMQLCTSNRGQHPDVVDNWENPDDMEPIGQKILKRAQKKQEQVQVQEQRDKEKVNIADIEDKLRHEDVQCALTANHPLGPGKKSIGTSKKSSPANDVNMDAIEAHPGAGQDNVDASRKNSSDINVRDLEAPSDLTPSHEHVVNTIEALLEDKVQAGLAECERRPSTIKQSKNPPISSNSPDVLTMVKAEISRGQPVVSGGLGNESDIYVPPRDSTQSGKSEKRDLDHVQLAKVAKSGKPAKPVRTQNLPSSTTQTLQVPKHVTLKHKKHTIHDDSQGPETATILVSNDEQAEIATASQPAKPGQPPRKKKKTTKSKAENPKLKTEPLSTTKPGPLAKNWECKNIEEAKQKGSKKDAQASQAENNSLVQVGGMVDDNEDVKPEFVDIIKVPATGDVAACQSGTSTVDLVKISKKGPANITATQVHGGRKSGQQMTYWQGLRKPSASESFPTYARNLDARQHHDQHIVAERGAWMGLANYQMTDFRHEICTEAEKVVKAFIRDYSETLSSPELISQYMMWLMTPTSPGKGIMATLPFMWMGWNAKAGGAKRWGMFHHELIICVMAEAHFMALPGMMDNTSTIPYPKGVLMLTAQVVERAVSMWTTEYALSAAERLKYGKDARKKTVKTKRVSQYLATLASWKEDKWNDLFADIKKAIKTSSSKKKRKISTSTRSASPNLIEEAEDVMFRSDPPEPDSEEGSDSDESAVSSGEEDEDEVQDDVDCSGCSVNHGEDDGFESDNGSMVIG
ncbi:hypothetical protein ARMGADRAFT_1070516 [Armillaria gallica]|uniref:Uncharacterized protein n=1 Tax=Armillaria gallica TaxID=47427 RepID=A0A2H3EX86_ARMGA|nr:hypothetical protein ARMGADRAFT_1070516 [Armillaria gallica]